MTLIFARLTALAVRVPVSSNNKAVRPADIAVTLHGASGMIPIEIGGGHQPQRGRWNRARKPPGGFGKDACHRSGVQLLPMEQKQVLRWQAAHFLLRVF